jgi:diketogulonate reductase-like aldo/keto reductase
MNIPVKTLMNGFSLPVYGLGLWQMGGRWEADTSQDDQEISAIRAALEAGITHLDTAESYGNGHAEELLSKAMQGFDRSKLIIATKVSADHQTYDGVLKSFEASLKRLGTGYVDLYMLHRYPESGIDIAKTMRAMDELVEQGLVKNIGVCNMTPNRFNDVQGHTKNKLVCNQVHYNVLVREVERRGVLKQCQADDAMLVAGGPLQKGMLPDAPLVQELAAKYGKTPAQVAINWLISQRNVVTISKTSSLEHLEENLGAVDWQMEAEDIERIRNDYPDQLVASDRVALDYEADVAV